MSESKIPQPPKRGTPKEIVSFVKVITQHVYLLDGVEHNPEEEDSREAFDAVVAEQLAAGAGQAFAEKFAEKNRFDKFGVSMEHGFYGEPVQAWFPGNTAVLLAPVKHDSYIRYRQMFAETWDVTLTKLFVIMHNATRQVKQKQLGIKEGDPGYEEPLQRDAMNGLIVPGLGPVYGTIDEVQTDIAAFVLSCHGKITGKVGKKYTLEPITFEEIISLLPVGFIYNVVEDGVNALEQILQVSTLFNPDMVKVELMDTGTITEDEGKNLTSSESMNATTKSSKKPLRTVGVLKE